MDTSKFIENIKKTGFVLEHEVATQLRNNGWSVINNRYYVDDHTETVREIDIVAYRARSAGDVDVYTVLLISCKKSNDNTWVFLSKDVNPNDPNLDFKPLHAWSNLDSLSHMLSQVSTKNTPVQNKLKIRS